MANLFEEALSSIGAAVADIREKVVEEGYFGRVVTDGQSAPEQASPAVNINVFEEALAERIQEPTAPDRTPNMPEPGGGREL